MKKQRIKGDKKLMYDNRNRGNDELEKEQSQKYSSCLSDVISQFQGRTRCDGNAEKSEDNNDTKISASADGDPRSWVCAR